MQRARRIYATGHLRRLLVLQSCERARSGNLRFRSSTHMQFRCGLVLGMWGSVSIGSLVTTDAFERGNPPLPRCYSRSLGLIGPAFDPF